MLTVRPSPCDHQASYHRSGGRRIGRISHTCPFRHARVCHCSEMGQKKIHGSMKHTYHHAVHQDERSENHMVGGHTGVHLECMSIRQGMLQRNHLTFDSLWRTEILPWGRGTSPATASLDARKSHRS